MSFILVHWSALLFRSHYICLWHNWNAKTFTAETHYRTKMKIWSLFTIIPIIIIIIRTIMVSICCEWWLCIRGKDLVGEPVTQHHHHQPHPHHNHQAYDGVCVFVERIWWRPSLWHNIRQPDSQTLSCPPLARTNSSIENTWEFLVALASLVSEWYLSLAHLFSLQQSAATVSSTSQQHQSAATVSSTSEQLYAAVSSSQQQQSAEVSSSSQQQQMCSKMLDMLEGDGNAKNAGNCWKCWKSYTWETWDQSKSKRFLQDICVAW